MQPHAFPPDKLIAAFVLWGGLCAWLIARRGRQLSLRTIFVLLTGFAVIAAGTTPAVQGWLGRYEIQQWIVWLLVFGMVGCVVFSFIVFVARVTEAADEKYRRRSK